VGIHLQESIVTKSLADEIAFRVESAILEGTFPPGSRLRQSELGERFRLSRIPVREALRKLQARNLIEVVPNRGATVRVPARKELWDVYEVRSELEGFASKLATSQVTARTIADLDRAQNNLVVLIDQLELLRADNGELATLHSQVNRANDDFHGVIHRTSGNERLCEVIQELGRIFPKEFVWRAIRSSDEMRMVNIEEHEQIRRALAEGGGERARKRLRDHILHARSILLAYLDERGFWK
jgi:DNA-binding GntR family transcriptional regulator